MTYKIDIILDKILSSTTDQIFVKGYGFLSFAKNIGKNIGKNASRNVSGKYSRNFRDRAKKSATDALKKSSKRVIKTVTNDNDKDNM